MLKAKALGLFLFFLVYQSSLFAQVSLVPVNHQVYEWLHLQRVKGNLENYNYEALPLSRKQILEKLNELKANEENLNRIDFRLLHWYIQEFSIEQLRLDQHNTYTQGWDSTIISSIKRKGKLFLSSQEPHLFAFANDSVVWALDYLSSGGRISVNDPGGNFDKNSSMTYIALQTYGSVYDRIGGHIKIYNPYSSESGVIQYHPEWGQTFDGRNPRNGATFYAEAMASLQYRNLGLHIGNADLKYGYRGDESLILRQDAGNFDWLRFNFDTKYFQYTFIHGSLKTNTVNVEVDGYPGVRSRISPDRWFALRRIQVTPFKWISIAFTESLIYSNRPLELAYMNPILPLRFGEYETNDKDNPIWFFDGSLRPVNNVELYGTIGIDDLKSWGDLLKPTGERSSQDAVVSYQIGGNFSLPTSTIINAEATLVDPYFYTHWQRFNTYEEFNSPLAWSVGPNSRQYFVSVRQWLPWRTFIDVSFGKIKKGLNEVDESGNLVNDVGGNLFEGQSGGDTVLLFDGDIHEWHQVKVKFEYEPIRGIQFFGAYSQRIMNRGTQLQDFDYLYAGFELNFYPALPPMILGKLPILSSFF